MTRRTAHRGRRLGVLHWLVAAYLVGTSLAAFAAWQWAYTTGLHAERAQQEARHQVSAVVLQAVRDPGVSASGTDGTVYLGADTTLVRAWWSAPGGTRRTGEIRVPAGTPAGRTVPVWTGASGRLTSPPLTRGQVTDYAVLAAVAAAVLLIVALTGAWRLARHRRAGGHGGQDKVAPRVADAWVVVDGSARVPGGPASEDIRRPAPACRAGPTAPAGQQQPVPASYAARWRAALRSADRADCCPASPSVIAVIPPTAARPRPTELLLCRHHYRVHRMRCMPPTRRSTRPTPSPLSPKCLSRAYAVTGPGPLPPATLSHRGN